MRITWKKQSGAALPEVLIAILILVSGAIASLSLMNAILKLAREGNNRIIAVNLAREGIEAMRHVRDSNWLLYSGSQRDADDQTRDHWNDGFDHDTGVAQVTLWYRVYLGRDLINGELRWFVDSWDTNCQADYTGTAGPCAADYYQLVQENTTLGTSIYNYSGISGGTASTFYRQIKITYLDSYDGNSDGTGEGNINDNMAYVQSRVYWMEGGNLKKIDLGTILADWYGRDDHTT